MKTFIKCTPKIGGKRQIIRHKCYKGCPFWDECINEIGDLKITDALIKEYENQKIKSK